MAKNILICDDNQDVVIQEEFVVEEALVAIKKRGNIRTFTSAKAFLTAGNQKNINVFACFDNEEVGSGTKQGAKSTFLFDVLWRTNQALGYSEEDFYRALAGKDIDIFLITGCQECFCRSKCTL